MAGLDGLIDQGDEDTNAFLKVLTEGAADLPQSWVLDRLVGTFRVRSEWEPIVGRGLRRTEGRCEGAWIFGGRMVEVRQMDISGPEVGRHTYAFDPAREDYVAISLNILQTFFELERGHFDAEEGLLVFEGDEWVRRSRQPIRFRRIVQFVDDDRYAMSITYPLAPPGSHGPLHATFDRIG